MARFDFPSAPSPHSVRPGGSFPGAQQHREKQRVVRHFTASDELLVPDGVTEILVMLQGAGGGGGASFGVSPNINGASGGASGETVSAIARVTPGQRYTITIGAGGSSGNAGGDSVFVGQGVNIRAAGGRAGVALGTATTPSGTSGESPVLEAWRFAGGAGGAGGEGANGASGAQVEGHLGGLGGSSFGSAGGGGGGGASPFGSGGAGGSAGGAGAPEGQSPLLLNSGAGGGGAGGTATGSRFGGQGSSGFIRLIYDV